MPHSSVKKDECTVREPTTSVTRRSGSRQTIVIRENTIHVVLVLVKIKTVDLSLRIFHCVIVAKCLCFHVSKVFYSFLPIIHLLSMPVIPTSSFEACCEQIAEIRNQPFQVSNCLGEA